MTDHAARAARSVADRARADWAALLSATVDQHRPIPAVQDRIDQAVRKLHQGQRRQSLAQAMAAIGAHLDLPTHQRVTGRVGCTPTVAVLDESHLYRHTDPYATVRDIAARHLTAAGSADSKAISALTHPETPDHPRQAVTEKHPTQPRPL